MKAKPTNSKLWFISAIFSLLLIIVSYFANNLPVFTGENLDQFFITQWLCEEFNISPSFDDSDAFFVNVSYDKELVKANGNLPKEVLGNTAITDRAKLYEFLKILKDNGGYKYIILDVLFDPNEVSKADSMLYPLIASMENIVIGRDKNIPCPNKSMHEKSAFADYYATITATNFVRYKYLNSTGEPYIPLKVYEDTYPEVKFERHGLKWMPIYTSGGRLCNNSCFITFDNKHFSPQRPSEQKDYYNLGTDLLGYPYLDSYGERIVALAKDKYVVVGNFVDDVHDTYMGLRPGPFIIYRALKTLEEGKHLVTFFSTLYWFAIFTLIFWWIISNQTADHLVPSAIRSSKLGRRVSSYKLLRFMVASLGYTLLLFICSTLQYVFTGSTYSIILPLYILMFTKLVCDYKRFE